MQTINVATQKINSTTLETYGIVVAAFLVTDQIDRIRFFEETFVVTNISPDLVFGMSFFILSGADINFLKKNLWWRFYTIKKAFLIAKRIEVVEKRELAVVVLDLGYEIFVVYIAFLESTSQESDIHPSCRA